MSDYLKKIKIKYEQLEKNRSSQRFKKVIGRLMKSKIFRRRDDIPLNTEKLRVQDCIWAGQFEPRIYEVLPALILKKPALFVDLDKCPKDLQEILKDLRKGKSTKDFRGLDPELYTQWITKIGHRGIGPAQLKSFRFNQEDLVHLYKLTSKGYTEIGAIRKALKLLSELETGN